MLPQYGQKIMRPKSPCQSLSNPSTPLLAAISVSPWIGSHKLLKLLHMGDALDILFLIEPLLDCRSKYNLLPWRINGIS